MIVVVMTYHHKMRWEGPEGGIGEVDMLPNVDELGSMQC